MTSTAAPGTPRMTSARILTDWLHPKTWIVVVALAIGWHSDQWSGVAWGVFGIVFAAVIPVALITRGVRKGHYADHNIGVRTQRIVIMALIIASVSVALAGMTLGHAPRAMLALMAAMIVTLVGLLAVTARWKISVHGAVSAGSVAMLALAYGPVLLAAFVVVAAVGWSRVELRDHTTAQVLAGSALGAAASAISYSLIS
ncbi:hypothetical protein [Actinomadura atramentaria]|uniref:hypothetical protein n=1 Tax=Actinomadura atramentaria TaxID=1990 RepID=UPI000361904D|nr:hypothetical protein [Actinomadura atramentaria]